MDFRGFWIGHGTVEMVVSSSFEPDIGDMASFWLVDSVKTEFMCVFEVFGERTSVAQLVIPCDLLTLNGVFVNQEGKDWEFASAQRKDLHVDAVGEDLVNERLWGETDRSDERLVERDGVDPS